MPLNLRLGFTQLDTATALTPNLPWPPLSHGVRLITDPEEIPRHLTGRDAEIHRDHARAAAANHLTTAWIAGLATSGLLCVGVALTF